MAAVAEDQTRRFYINVGRLVRDARKRVYMTQSQLAKAVGLTRTSITNLEAGRQHIPLHLLASIAAALEVEAGGLLPDLELFREGIEMPDLSEPLANDLEGMRAFVRSTVSKVTVSGRGA